MAQQAGQGRARPARRVPPPLPRCPHAHPSLPACLHGLHGVGRVEGHALTLVHAAGQQSREAVRGERKMNGVQRGGGQQARKQCTRAVACRRAAPPAPPPAHLRMCAAICASRCASGSSIMTCSRSKLQQEGDNAGGGGGERLREATCIRRGAAGQAGQAAAGGRRRPGHACGSCQEGVCGSAWAGPHLATNPL